MPRRDIPGAVCRRGCELILRCQWADPGFARAIDVQTEVAVIFWISFEWDQTRRGEELKRKRSACSDCLVRLMSQQKADPRASLYSPQLVAAPDVRSQLTAGQLLTHPPMIFPPNPARCSTRPAAGGRQAAWARFGGGAGGMAAAMRGGRIGA